MTTTATTPIASDTTEPTTARRLVVGASLVAVAAELVWMAMIGAIIPPLALFAAVTLALIVAGRRWPRLAVVSLGLLALVAVVAGLEFLLADLAGPVQLARWVRPGAQLEHHRHQVQPLDGSARSGALLRQFAQHRAYQDTQPLIRGPDDRFLLVEHRDHGCAPDGNGQRIRLDAGLVPLDPRGTHDG